MLLLITVTETDEKTGRRQTLVSHGVNLDRGEIVILPSETPKALGAVFDPDYGEWLLQEYPIQPAQTEASTHHFHAPQNARPERDVGLSGERHFARRDKIQTSLKKVETP